MHNQPSPSVVHLNRYYHFTELMRDPNVEGRLARYRSDYDSSIQSLLVLQPTASKPQQLFFFFHGMDGDCGDGVVVRDIIKRSNAKVIAIGGRGPAWVSDAFLADAEQVIRNYATDFPDYYLIGVSMGGTQVLALAGLLSEDLRRAIAGVVAIIPGVNLPAIAANSLHERVKNTLRDSVKGDLVALESRSPTKVMTGYTPGLPFVVFHNQADTLLLSDELRPFITQLRENGHPVTTFSAPGGHNFTYKNFDYEAALKRLGSDGDENEPPLIGGEHR